MSELSPRHSLKFASVWVALILIFFLAMGVDMMPHVRAILMTPSSSPEQIDLAGKIVGDVSRILGVTLSMLIALCALAIPLTANVYTPKLIEIFLADRVNRVVLGYFVLANGVVLWNKFIIYSAAPPDSNWRALVSLTLALIGLLSIAPYFLYVLRFLVPRSIVGRLRNEILGEFQRASRLEDAEEMQAALLDAVTNVQYIGKITLRAVERYDRDTANEGLQALRVIFDRYCAQKEYLPDGFLTATCRDMLGLGPELALEVERTGATVEVALLQELSLLLSVALTKLPEIVAQIAALTRHFAARTAERRDVGVREVIVLHFNTFLRQALKQKNPDGFYKLVYQYRRFAEDLLAVDLGQARRVAFFLDYYGHQAVRMGMSYLINVVAYDLAALCDTAYLAQSPARDSLLTVLIELDRDRVNLLDLPGVVKAQIILAAKMRTRGDDGPYERLLTELRKVPTARLKEAFRQIITAREENFWEIADRRRHLDHVAPRFRAGINHLRGALLGETEPGVDTLVFLEGKKKKKVPGSESPVSPEAATIAQETVATQETVAEPETTDSEGRELPRELPSEPIEPAKP